MTRNRPCAKRPTRAAPRIEIAKTAVAAEVDAIAVIVSGIEIAMAVVANEAAIVVSVASGVNAASVANARTVTAASAARVVAIVIVTATVIATSPPVRRLRPALLQGARPQRPTRLHKAVRRVRALRKVRVARVTRGAEAIGSVHPQPPSRQPQAPLPQPLRVVNPRPMRRPAVAMPSP